MKVTNVLEFYKQFPSDDACLEHLMVTRYGLKSECPHCKKESKFTKITERKAYACQYCGGHIYPCVGTPFEGSRTSLQLWFYAIYLFTQTRSGVSAKELQRQLGVTYKCAWRMGHEIRQHIGFVDGNAPLDGEIEVDETYIGGHREGKRGRGAEGKTILFGMLDRDGDIMTKVVTDTKGTTLKGHIADNVTEGSTIHSDEYRPYTGLDNMGYTHKSCNHVAKKYSVNGSHVNTLEGFWSRLKSSINGTHINISGKHLDKYAAEFEYRLNSRLSPEKMLPELLGTFPLPLKK
jgi:transposase-like protein